MNFKKSRSIVLGILGGTFLIAVTAAGFAEEEKELTTQKETVRITIQTVPSRKAMVKWGKKKLGVIPAPKPLILERPRDSGPMDIVLRVPGYLPVHTRATTFSDIRLMVKLTPETEKHTLFGYRNEPVNPDGGTNGSPDGGIH
jgi:hypothetical protein